MWLFTTDLPGACVWKGWSKAELSRAGGRRGTWESFSPGLEEQLCMQASAALTAVSPGCP